MSVLILFKIILTSLMTAEKILYSCSILFDIVFFVGNILICLQSIISNLLEHISNKMILKKCQIIFCSSLHWLQILKLHSIIVCDNLFITSFLCYCVFFYSANALMLLETHTHTHTINPCVVFNSIWGSVFILCLYSITKKKERLQIDYTTIFD